MKIEVKHDKLLVLDLDHTIFNTTKYVAALKKALGKLGVTEEEFNENRQYIKDCCHVVDIDRFAHFLSVENKSSIHETIHEVLKDQSKNFIFSDVNAFLARYQKKFDIIILTQGDEEQQSEKIQHGQLPKEIEVFITKGSKVEELKDVVPLYKEIHYIDDKAKHIDAIKKAYPRIKTYFIQRPEDKPYAAQESKLADEIIKNLNLNLTS